MTGCDCGPDILYPTLLTHASHDHWLKPDKRTQTRGRHEDKRFVFMKIDGCLSGSKEKSDRLDGLRSGSGGGAGRVSAGVNSDLRHYTKVYFQK